MVDEHSQDADEKFIIGKNPTILVGGHAKDAPIQRALNAMGAKCIEDIDDTF